MIWMRYTQTYNFVEVFFFPVSILINAGMMKLRSFEHLSPVRRIVPSWKYICLHCNKCQPQNLWHDKEKIVIFVSFLISPNLYLESISGQVFTHSLHNNAVLGIINLHLNVQNCFVFDWMFRSMAILISYSQCDTADKEEQPSLCIWKSMQRYVDWKVMISWYFMERPQNAPLFYGKVW